MEKQTIIDISWPIQPTMTTYKNKNDVHITINKTFEENHVRESSLCCGMHTGTHVDAPAHFLANGSTIDQMDLTKLTGTCLVIDCTQAQESIEKEMLATYPIHPGDIILLKTSNSATASTAPHRDAFVYLSAQGASYLVEKNIHAVGIDYLGIERNQPNHETHLTLLQKDIPIIEGLRLGHVKPGRYFFVCLPLALQGAEAAPARAILIPQAMPS
ncbi:MAG: Arylformamidase [candidate division TM6 bacterium GW2011_GWF2_38_10]|nr:MAG: Arylformamidase [candidate division TM6 bacterium GW2011_GWF2_38_10]